MKRVLAAVLVLALFGCTRISDPAFRHGAHGTPLEGDGDGGGGAGGGQSAQIYFGTPANHVIPVYVSNPSSVGLRGWHVTVDFGGGTAFSSWVEGPLTANNSPVTQTVSSGSKRTLDEVITSAGCVSSGGIFGYLTVTGSGTVTLTSSITGDPTASPTLRDCSNGDVEVIYGSPSQVTL